MVTVNMEQIIDFRNNEGAFGEMNLPLKVAYKINKIKKAVEKEGDFYAEKFEDIVNKYAKKDENGELVFNEDGSQIMIKEDMIEQCNKELNDLQTLEIEVDNYNLTIDDFGEDIECTPDSLAALMPFLS